MVEGYSMGFWYVFVIIMALLALVGVVALLSMLVNGIYEFKEWLKGRRNV